jgi:hypothetical protein
MALSSCAAGQTNGAHSDGEPNNPEPFKEIAASAVPYYYHLKSAKASQIFRVAFGYQCESVCICGSVFLVAASLRQVVVVPHNLPA